MDGVYRGFGKYSLPQGILCQYVNECILLSHLVGSMGLEIAPD